MSGRRSEAGHKHRLIVTYRLLPLVVNQFSGNKARSVEAGSEADRRFNRPILHQRPVLLDEHAQATVDRPSFIFRSELYTNESPRKPCLAGGLP